MTTKRLAYQNLEKIAIGALSKQESIKEKRLSKNKIKENKELIKPQRNVEEPIVNNPTNF